MNTDFRGQFFFICFSHARGDFAERNLREYGILSAVFTLFISRRDEMQRTGRFAHETGRYLRGLKKFIGVAVTHS